MNFPNGVLARESLFRAEIEKRALQRKNIYADWLKNKTTFLLNLELHNKKIDALKKNYFEGKDSPAIIEYYTKLLLNSTYPFGFEKNVIMQYSNETKMIILNYQLPSMENVPTIKEIRFIRSKNETKVFHISESAKKKLYDDTLYRVTLKTIWEVFSFDHINAIEGIILNGWAKSIDRSTGLPIQPFILSIQASKQSFLQLDLRHVIPKECFKKLKGVGSSSLHDMAAVKPIASMNLADKRFIEGRAIADSLGESKNIAEISWEDFEHLIRELFEKEFAQNGGEVRVTQSSRDGGVDAVAFDPDPIRGGKIVIQAKRYTNVVGVSAVRDLYGTVINEGASKGILITTAEYGKDSYEFAKGKPITLLNGGHLLHLLKRHGYSARIDLAEAKKQNDLLARRDKI